MRPAMLGVALCACACSAVAARGPADATIHIGSAIPGTAPVPRNFVSVSVEVQNAVKYFAQPTYVQVLKNLRRSEGGASAYTGPLVRIGGNSADRSCWGPAAAAMAPAAGLCTTYNISEADFDSYKTFVRETAKEVNTKLVLDVNFGLTPDPNALAVPYARAVTTAGMWDIVAAVEIGNEENLYASQGHYRNGSWGYAEYETEFSKFAAAVVEEGGMPAGAIRGGTWCCYPKDEWATRLPAHLAKHRQTMNSFSLHQYAASHDPEKPKEDQESLWGQGRTWGVLHRVYARAGEKEVSLAKLYADVRAAGLPVVLGEGNSASRGGIPGVSDTWQATLWGLDFLPLLAQAGASAMHVHGGPAGPYTPVAYDKKTGAIKIQPIYYAMLAFAELTANNAVWLAADFTAQGGGDVRCTAGLQASGVCCAASCGTCGGPGCNGHPGGSAACCTGAIAAAGKSCGTHSAPCVMDSAAEYPVIVHAVRDDALGATRMLVVAKKPTITTPQAVDVCGAFTGLAGSYIVLTAPSATAKFGDGLTYGGQTFDTSTDGRLQGKRETHEAAAATGADGEVCFRVVVPPLSAVLLTLKPAGPAVA